ncbi:type II toxin-antitoxin system RelE/ParE family toxin [Glacieibacterium frigidum]|uniref:type II toxin-antitoxin system RelE/ParE family toxin n=1 Tax=Glacieibacterium frigidum TaxID=2593303 RepID=UPI00163D4A21|nr:type II toxin-antitoxin system RelE/ParE family toxin [Glacieibacterium frigidum]
MTYRLLERADLDIAEILDFIANFDEAAADRLNRQIVRAFAILGDSPMLGHTRTDLTTQDLRFWPVRHWLIVHRGRNPVEIVAVLDARRDLFSLLP